MSEKEKTIIKEKSNTYEGQKNFREWIKVAIALVTAVATILGLFVAVPDIINNSNKQTQVVIEPRDGDIIVQDGDNYKLLQLIRIEDIGFPSKIQEIQYTADKSTYTRVDINNINGADWSKRDSFRYVINEFSINPNKIINLLDNTESITVFCDFYTEKNISTNVDLGNNPFKFEMRKSIDEQEFEASKTNIASEYEYVTNEGIDDGIEWVKIRVVIVYKIGERRITDTITSDWVETDEDRI